MDYAGQRSQLPLPGQKLDGDGPGSEEFNSGNRISEVGVWCERCNNRLVELKKQALRLMIMHPSLMKLAMKVGLPVLYYHSLRLSSLNF